MTINIDQKRKTLRSKEVRKLIMKSIEIVNELEYNYPFDEEI